MRHNHHLLRSNSLTPCRHEPDSGILSTSEQVTTLLKLILGLLITVFQFVIATTFALPSQLRGSTSGWHFKSPAIPLPKLVLISFLFFAINMLNNWAFAFNISVPMHIILRSFGSVTSLVMGWIWGRTYSAIQGVSIGALTVGVVVSAWADAKAKVSTCASDRRCFGI